MRGSDRRSGSFFSYVDLEARVRGNHPLRAIRRRVEAALGALSEDFSELYSGMGRPSIPPEMLLRAMLLQAFYSIRSERQLMERLEVDLLFRWSVGLGVDDPAWEGLSGVLCARPVCSSRPEPVTEDDCELGFGLKPLARRPLPLFGRVIEDEV